jgi:hypothetical protein
MATLAMHLLGPFSKLLGLVMPSPYEALTLYVREGIWKRLYIRATSPLVEFPLRWRLPAKVACLSTNASTRSG